MFRRYPGAEQDPDYVRWEDMDPGARDQYNAGAEAVAAAVRAEYEPLMDALAVWDAEHPTLVGSERQLGLTYAGTRMALSPPHDTPEGIPDES